MDFNGVKQDAPRGVLQVLYICVLTFSVTAHSRFIRVLYEIFSSNSVDAHLDGVVSSFLYLVVSTTPIPLLLSFVFHLYVTCSLPSIYASTHLSFFHHLIVFFCLTLIMSSHMSNVSLLSFSVSFASTSLVLFEPVFP